MVFTLFLATILIVQAFSSKRYPPSGVIHRRSFETFTSATFYIPACSRQQAKTYNYARHPGRVALLNIRCLVKGSHLCRFEVNIGEVFTATKNRAEHANAFKVVNHRGQIGHLQSKLVDPLGPLQADISVLVNFFY